MKNKKFSISIADLNTGDQIRTDCRLTTSTGDLPTQLEASPQHIFFNNDCGKHVEINFISKKELKEYNADSTAFEGILVTSGDVFSSAQLLGEAFQDLTIDYLLVKKVEAGDATAVLDIYGINYR